MEEGEQLNQLPRVRKSSRQFETIETVLIPDWIVFSEPLMSPHCINDSSSDSLCLTALTERGFTDSLFTDFYLNSLCRFYQQNKQISVSSVCCLLQVCVFGGIV